MRTVVILLLFTNWNIHLIAQSVLTTKFPKVKVTIKLSDSGFLSSDSVKFFMTVTNNSGSLQKILFDKPLTKTFPWGTTVIVNNSYGKSMVKISNRELISSQLYTEEQVEKQNIYSELKPKQSISHVYYLSNIPIFNTSDGKLPKGKYSLQIGYYSTLSNKVFFMIK